MESLQQALQDKDEIIANLRTDHEAALNEARAETRASHQALTELKLRHDALSKTLKQLQAEHRILSEDHKRLNLVVEAQAQASAEQDARADVDLRAQLERALRSPTNSPRYGDMSRLREELINASREIKGGKKAGQEKADHSPVPESTRRMSRVAALPKEARGGHSRNTPSPAAPQAPHGSSPPLAQLTPGGPRRQQSELADRLRELESAATPNSASLPPTSLLIEENSALRKQVEQLTAAAAQREALAQAQERELSDKLVASEARAREVHADLQRQVHALRWQSAAATSHHVDHGNGLRTSSAHGPRVASSHPRSRAVSLHPGAEVALASLVDHVSREYARPGMATAADSEDESSEDEDEARRRALRAQANQLALRRANGAPRPVVPRPPATGKASGRQRHALLSNLDPGHSAVVQLKAAVQANANRPRLPAAGDLAVRRHTIDATANSRRKTIETLRTRLDKSKAAGPTGHHLRAGGVAV
mmetsp:Transcript_21697/g.63977  ORF Transcript_21697/g.63977 Transcript_21697/m.63977 type:complete len:482 (+) Transcript_21697:123-1568(+)